MISIAIIRETQVKTTTRYHLTVSEWLPTKGTQMTSVVKNVKKREPLYTVGGNVNWYSHGGKQYRGFSKT